MSDEEGAARDPWWKRQGWRSAEEAIGRAREDSDDRDRNTYDPNNYQED